MTVALSKVNYHIYTVNILPFEAATIQGSDTVCYLDNNTIFRAPLNSPSSYLWSVNNGSIVNFNAESSRINIDWGTSGSGRVDLLENL